MFKDVAWAELAAAWGGGRAGGGARPRPAESPPINQTISIINIKKQKLNDYQEKSREKQIEIMKDLENVDE